ncbi:GAP family protein [Conexibacter woesei]|uniref:GAP family protein n=1 Tax=Conexibacter woesei TaxID=191495 RepID=UPI000419F13C|nr:GAP family protein [Conexibacter woesei]
MADAIGQVLSLAVGVAISPVPIIAVVLMLATPRGRVNGPAFLAGWLLGLAVVGTIVLVASNGAGATDSDATPATWVSWLKIVLGVLLVLVAVRQWRGRPQAGEAGTLPKWMQAVDTFTPGRAVAMGVALSAINPKNLLLTVGAAAAIAQADVSTGDEVVALAVFVVIGTLGPGAPVLISWFMGSRSREILDGLKAWMGMHNAAIMAVLCLVIGARLAGDGISGLGS